MAIGTAKVSWAQIKAQLRGMARAGLFGIMPSLSMPIRAKAGRATGMARIILEEAVYQTADLAHFLDLPRDSPVSGSQSSIPFSISTCLMNQLLANPPVIQAIVDVVALSIISLAPVAEADRVRLICLIMSAMPILVTTALAYDLVMS